jgi:hypothetical protein
MKRKQAPMTPTTTRQHDQQRNNLMAIERLVERSIAMTDEVWWDEQVLVARMEDKRWCARKDNNNKWQSRKPQAEVQRCMGKWQCRFPAKTLSSMEFSAHSHPHPPSLLLVVGCCWLCCLSSITVVVPLVFRRLFHVCVLSTNHHWWWRWSDPGVEQGQAREWNLFLCWRRCCG